MSKSLKVVLLTVAGIVMIAVAGGLLLIYSGAYNVAATEDHWDVTRWVLNTTQQNSVGARADDVDGAVPTDSAEILHGFEHFHAMCVQCHGAPGIDRGELGQGLNPVPPRLHRVADRWTDQELFWITKHGIRLAGMPAFGTTHSDEQLWGIVGFVRRLEGMSTEEYREWVQALKPVGDSAGSGSGTTAAAGGHSHAPGTPAHSH